ncbi:hypothetical protein NVP1215B_079 [Vibrio phage 1.215.B._10N.222.54.F7]|nr:hypothetical protein NVP1215A_079 [Vibrio phage 1.215.A._10N.222.54.F7]AUR96102.1 hypothetical protein NVP1215B_079 [Vibrio phage 1.215.B._10N.222.54.F7]
MIKLKLGDVDLNPNMHLPELNQSNSIAMTTRPTLSGGVAVFQKAIFRGQKLQLIATNDQGWVTKENRDKLLEQAGIVGNILVLTAGSKKYNVMFDHTDGAAVSLEPFINRLDALDGDYFTGTINLIHV